MLHMYNRASRPVRTRSQQLLIIYRRYSEEDLFRYARLVCANENGLLLSVQIILAMGLTHEVWSHQSLFIFLSQTPSARAPATYLPSPTDAQNRLSQIFSPHSFSREPVSWVPLRLVECSLAPIPIMLGPR